MATSLRHRLVRTLLQRVLKPLARPSTPLAFQRALLDAATLVMRRPPGLHSAKVTLGGLPARRLTPANADGTRHVLYLHGGAYISGSPASHAGLAGQVGAAAGATVWLVDYRLAPEHPFPAARDDALAAWQALLGMGIAPSALAIAGDSAGGGLTLAATVAIRDAGLPLPGALVVLSPWADLTLSGRSVQGLADIEPMLNADWLDWAAGAYCGAHASGRSTLRTDPGVSPLFADLRGLPPLLVQVGSDEILLDDATGLTTLARRAGTDVTLQVFAGLWHVFQAQAGLLPEADAALAGIGDFLRTRLAPPATAGDQASRARSASGSPG